MRWKPRGTGQRGAGDPYYLTPAHQEVRSALEARRWMERGGVPDAPRRSTPAPPRVQYEPTPVLPGARRPSVLLTPVLSGDAARVAAVLQHHPEVMQADILQRAVLNIDVLTVLLQHLPLEVQAKEQILDGTDATGHSALSMACLDQSPEGHAADVAVPAVKLLLQAGAAVDRHVRNQRSSALNEACASVQHRFELIEALLFAGANADLRTPNGGWTALHTAAEYGNAHTVLQLVESGAALDLSDAEGRTALCWAALTGQYRAVSVLLHCGADPSLPVAGGETALDLALEMAPRSKASRWCAALLSGERRERLPSQIRQPTLPFLAVPCSSCLERKRRRRRKGSWRRRRRHGQLGRRRPATGSGRVIKKSCCSAAFAGRESMKSWR